MKKILISGGTGLIGKKLIPQLIDQGYTVHVLSRSPKKSSKNLHYFIWDPRTNSIDEKCFDTINGIIHLAGEGIVDKRWSNARKKEIIDSRVQTANLLYKYIKEKNGQLDFYISASGAGYYGAVTNEKIYAEEDPAHTDFMGECCMLWEKSADQFLTNAQRVVKLRICAVLDTELGALPKISNPIRYGMGSPLGSGKQYMSWIHVDDLVNVFIQAVSDVNYKGVYNTASPQHTTNKEFIQACANALKKPLFMPNVPAFILKFALGEMACVVLEGSRISVLKLQKQGFIFKYDTLDKALTSLLKK